MLCLQELVRKKLFAKELRDIETDRIIVDNIVSALAMLNVPSCSALQRREVGVLLAGCASPTLAKSN